MCESDDTSGAAGRPGEALMAMPTLADWALKATAAIGIALVPAAAARRNRR
jgi:hypothetical protein